MIQNDQTKIHNTKVEETNDLLKARASSVQSFGSIDHRLEFVSNVDGVEYINDSKATDENSTWYSLEFMNKPVVWIVGTPDSEIDYDLFADKVESKVKAIICLGAGDESLRSAFHNSVDSFTAASSVSECVRLASELSEDGDVVLFSPACNSFEMFRNYQDRGVKFREAVTLL
ncbi:MAG: hypothetical protein HRT71_18215 [Flavobacteriales bacterium]|nr:hypothetical protein [Flavobacteriales bacterium]